MLVYINDGPRDFRRQPSLPNRRGRWEFLAVISGRAAPTGLPGAWPPRARCLYLLPPESRHGWSGDARPCRILVAHALALPEAVAAAARRAGPICVDLPAGSVADLAARVADLKPSVYAPDRRFHLGATALLAELCLLLEPVLPATLVDADAADAWARIDAWLDAHLREATRVGRIAAGTGLPVPRLRELCRAATGQGLREHLAERRAHRARALMADADCSLAAVARAVGYRDGSALTHAIRRVAGCRPRDLRGG